MAMFILILTLTAVITVSFGNQSMIVDSQTSSEALGTAQKLLEKAQADSRKDFNLVNPLNQAAVDSHCPSNPVGNSQFIYDGTKYCYMVDVATRPDFFTKLVTAKISWFAENNRTQKVELSTLVTNFNNAVGGDTCGSVLSETDAGGNIIHNDWTKPQLTGKTFADLVHDTDPASQYVISDVDAYQGKLYVTLSNSSETVSRNPSSTPFPAIASLGGAPIRATNFGFNIPAGATILGVKAVIQKHWSGGSTGTVADNEVRLIKPDGSLGSKNKNAGSVWPSSAAVTNYGSDTDLWDETNLQAADINSSNFGVAISAIGSVGSDRIANIDSIQITVTYIKEFYVFDIAKLIANDPNPLIGGLSSNPGTSAGFKAVVTDGKYAYVATEAGPASGQLQVIDLSANPFTVKKLAGGNYIYPVPGVTGAGGEALGNSIFYRDGYVYIGLTKTGSGPEFNVIDVHDVANLSASSLVAAASIGNWVNAVFVKDHYAFVASPNAEDLRVYDIAPDKWSLAMAPVGSFAAAGGLNGKSLYVVGDTVYFGRTVSSNEFYALDARNLDLGAAVAEYYPSSPPCNGSHRAIGVSVNDLLARDYLTFLITTDGQFQILRTDDKCGANMARYDAVPVSVPSTDNKARLDCEGNYIFVSSNASAGKGQISFITGKTE